MISLKTRMRYTVQAEKMKTSTSSIEVDEMDNSSKEMLLLDATQVDDITAEVSSDSSATTQTSDDLETGSTITSASDTTTSASPRAVTFGTVEVRYYERVVGDYPTVRFGIPLGIGWSYVEQTPIQLDQYTEQFESKGCFKLSRVSRREIFYTHCDFTQLDYLRIESKLDRRRRMETKIMGRLQLRLAASKPILQLRSIIHA